MKRAWLWLIQHSLNHLTLAIARSRHGEFALVRVVGRKSGISRENPVIAAPVAGGFMLELTYGPEVQWFKNVQAAGGCTIVRHQVEHRIVRIEPVDTATGISAFAPFQRRVLRLLRRKEFVRFLEG